MARGSIIGQCRLCYEHVYEDDGDFINYSGAVQHDDCKDPEQLRYNNRQLRAELQEYKKWLG